MQKFPYNFKRNIFFAITALFVAFIRSNVQYHTSLFESFYRFFTWWITHYFIVAILAMVSYGIIKGTEKFFFGYDSSEQGLSVNAAIVYISIVIIVCSLFVFFIS